jgi:hypothetical protein
MHSRAIRIASFVSYVGNFDGSQSLVVSANAGRSVLSVPSIIFWSNHLLVLLTINTRCETFC